MEIHGAIPHVKSRNAKGHFELTMSEISCCLLVAAFVKNSRMFGKQYFLYLYTYDDKTSFEVCIHS